MPKCACPHCDNSADVPENYIGKVVKCGRCKQSFQAEVDFMGELLEEEPPAQAPVVVAIDDSQKKRRRPVIEVPDRSSIDWIATAQIWGGWASIIIGIPLLLIPPIGLGLIGSGVIGLATGNLLRIAKNVEILLVHIANKD